MPESVHNNDPCADSWADDGTPESPHDTVQKCQRNCSSFYIDGSVSTMATPVIATEQGQMLGRTQMKHFEHPQEQRNLQEPIRKAKEEAAKVTSRTEVLQKQWKPRYEAAHEVSSCSLWSTPSGHSDIYAALIGHHHLAHEHTQMQHAEMQHAKDCN